VAHHGLNQSRMRGRVCLLGSTVNSRYK
jgi:hypothetical protein